MTFLALILLLILILLPGLASWVAFGQRLAPKLSGLEIIFIWLLSGTALVSWLSLTLAEFGQFSLPLMAVIIIVPSLLVIGWWGWHGRLRIILSSWTWHWHDLAVALLLVVLVLLSGRPSEYVIGGRDHGVYVNTGVHIAKTGEILVQDAEMTAVPTELRATLVRPETRLYQAGFPGPWSEGQRISGLTIRDLDAGIYLPHAFHLYPALIALFFAVGGIQTALFTTMFLSLIGSLAIYLTAARLFGKPVGLLTLLLLTFSVTQVWFTGYPSAEIMVQPLFWGGLFAFILLLENEDRYTAVLAGGCLGLLHLAKLDTVLIPPTFGLVLLYLWLRRQFSPAYWWGIGVFLLLSLQAVWHASFIATIYFLDHAVRNLLPTFIADALVLAADGHPYPLDWLGRLWLVNWPAFLFAGIGLLALLGLLHWLKRPDNHVLTRLAAQAKRRQMELALLLSGIILVTAVLDWQLELTALEDTLWSVQLSRLYLTRAGLLLGMAGWLWLIYRLETMPQRAALLLLVSNILPLYLLGPGTAPDHFWVIRRFITITFPGFILAASYLIVSLWPRQQQRWPLAILPLGLTAVLLLGFWQHTRFIAGVVEYEGLTEQLQTLADGLPSEAVLLWETPNSAQRLDLPLWFLFDKTIFTVRAEVKEEVALQTAVAHWVSNGRPVYWLAVNDLPPPAWAGWAISYSHSQTINTPLVETPRDHIPSRVQRFQAELNIYQLDQP